MNSDSLAGLKVVVTRPEAQQQALCDAIEAAGGRAVKFPLLAINPLTDAAASQDLKTRIQNLDHYQILIFVSTNAARYGAEWINAYWPQFPLGIEVIAVGPTTANAVADLLGCTVTKSAAGMTSEDLLALPGLSDVNGKRIGILRGRGGRELIAESLRVRGAEVDYLEVYQRSAVHYTSEEINRLLRARSVDVLSITSGESLSQLLAILGDNKAEMSLLPLLVPSSRVAELAQQAGFNSVINANGADESSFIAALQSLADKTQ
jgi:uroporphyrinogen-III synthase